MDLQQIIKDEEYDIYVSCEDLVDVLVDLKKEHQFQMLLDIIALDNKEREGARFELVYLLLSMEHHKRLRVRISFSKNDLVPSVQKIWTNAYRLEHEVWDMMGICFAMEDGNRILTHADFIGHPLRKDYSPNKLKKAKKVEEIALDNWLTIHPHHPVMEGSFQLSVQLDGEVIKGSVLETGFLHRGIEKISESRNFNQIIPLVERLNHNSAAMNGIAWAKAVEEHLGLGISDRSKVLRMIFFELSRIYDHITVVSKIADLVESSVVSAASRKQLDLIARLFRSYCGEGLLGNIARIGGVAHDIPMGWVSECYQIIRLVQKDIGGLYKRMVKSRIWMERTRVCSVTSDVAINLGCTGPCLRACGVNYDIRKTAPYYFYKDLEFEVPLGLNGDAYDRSLVRIEECLQSISIIGQLLDNVPAGDTVGIFAANPNDLERVAKMKGGETYSFVEAANGELGFFLVTDGSPYPYRLKIRTPSLPLAQLFPAVAMQASLGDALLSLKSLNVVAGELDR